MKESKQSLSDPLYALVGLLAVAIMALVLVLIAKPIVRNSRDSRLARQEEEVFRVKSMLMSASADSTFHAIQFQGTLTEEREDGKKSKDIPILMSVDLTLTQYNRGEVSGDYRYASQPKDNTIALAGTCDLSTGEMVLVCEALAERFELRLNETNDAFEGYWMKYKSKRQLRKKTENYQQRMACSLTKNQ